MSTSSNGASSLSSSTAADEENTPTSSADSISKEHIPHGVISSTMDMSYFQQWQQMMQHQRMEQDHMEDDRGIVPDSISPYASQATDGYFADSQSQHVLSDDECHRLLENPPRSFHSSSNLGLQNFRNGMFSCPQPSSNLSMGAIDVRPTASEATATEEVHRAQPKKRPAKKSAPAPKKAKKTQVVISNDDGEGDIDGDDPVDRRWSDAEVQQLISFRSEMDEEFAHNAKKQGVHMWDRLQEKMLASCDGFNKSAEACRKKWKSVYRKYCTDKRIMNISGEGRKVTWKFFDEIDQGFNNQANVRKLVHGDAQGIPNPCPLDLNEPGDENQAPNIQIADGSNEGSIPAQHTPCSVKSRKLSGADLYNIYMGDMVTNNTEMGKDFCETTGVLKDIRIEISRLIDKL